MKQKELLTYGAIAAGLYLLSRGSSLAGINGRMTTDQKKVIDRFIIDTIETDGYDYRGGSSDRDKLKFLADTFKDEYGWSIPRMGTQRALEEWFRGLPSVFSLPYNNYDIIQLAKQWGSLPNNATERQEDKILDNYWKFMAAKTLQLMRKNKISI